MTFSQRVKIVKEFEDYLDKFNKRNKENGIGWGIVNNNLSFLTWLENNKDLIKEDKQWQYL